jgi:hypothetical protein
MMRRTEAGRSLITTIMSPSAMASGTSCVTNVTEGR